MSLFDAIALGIVQGLTEFLPISSSGHLVMAQTVLDAPSPGIVLEVALHVATLISVLIVYRRRLAGLAVGALRGNREDLAYIGLLVLATIPAAVVGLFFEDAIGRTFETPAITGFMLLVTGVLLYSTRFADEHRPLVRPTAALAVFIGIAQAFAILPGISRSGSTITAGLWGRLAGDKAAEFSFLMSIPAIAGAAVLQVPALGSAVGDVGGLALTTSFFAALISGVAAILALIWLVRRQIFHVFAYYTWAVGAAFLLYLVLR